MQAVEHKPQNLVSGLFMSRNVKSKLAHIGRKGKPFYILRKLEKGAYRLGGVKNIAAVRQIKTVFGVAIGL